MEEVKHTIEPVFDKNSKILILGTMPSPKSREVGFYYSHPQNRFWKVLSGVLEKPIPDDISGRKRFLLENGIALWDVLKSCDIENADDSTIKNAIPNDFSVIFDSSPIQQVFTTGKKATALYEKHRINHMPPQYLPSTSPANCRMPLSELIENYRIIGEFLL